MYNGQCIIENVQLVMYKCAIGAIIHCQLYIIHYTLSIIHYSFSIKER
jgi:hypothetical protein